MKSRCTCRRNRRRSLSYGRSFCGGRLGLYLSRTLALEPLEERTLLSGLHSPSLEASADASQPVYQPVEEAALSPYVLVPGAEPVLTESGDAVGSVDEYRTGGYWQEWIQYQVVCSDLTGSAGSGNAGFRYSGSIPITIAPGWWGAEGQPVWILLQATIDAGCLFSIFPSEETASISYSAAYSGGGLISGGRDGSVWAEYATNSAWLGTVIGSSFSIMFDVSGSAQYEPESSGGVNFVFTYTVNTSFVQPTPDIVMLSATTEDSQSVTFEYEITGEGIDPFEVAIFRSEDDKFDPIEDPPVGVPFTITETSPGVHSHTRENVELPPDPEHKYVFAVADLENDIVEANDGNNAASFRKWLIGACVHGYEYDGVIGDDHWIHDMAGLLQEKGYDNVKPYDWAKMSSEWAVGRARLAGELLVGDIARMVSDLPLRPDDVVDVHLIGHSRGTVVISEAFKALPNVWDTLPEGLRHGYLKMTMLDPHPARNYANFPGGVRCSVNPGLRSLGWARRNAVHFVQGKMRDPRPSVPDIVDQAEVYYQETYWNEIPRAVNPREHILNLWGETVEGAVNDGRWNHQLGIGHSEIVDQYRNEIVANLGSTVQSVVAEETSSDIDFLYPDFVDDYAVAQAMVARLESAKAAYEVEDFAAATASLNEFVETIETERDEHIDPEMADFLLMTGLLLIRGIETDLGPINFRLLDHLDLSTGVVQYSFETTRPGVLTLEASFVGAGDSVAMKLYDESPQLLATSTLQDGKQRIDWQVEAGQEYLLELNGSNTDVDLRLVNLVSHVGTTVTVDGTAESDQFEFDAAASRLITINGVEYGFSNSEIASATFHGAGGDDTAVFHGSTVAETVKLWPDRGRVEGDGYVLITKNVEATTAYGGGGADVAVLNDSLGPDAFTAGPDSAELTGPGFALAVHSFPAVHAFASDDGETDTAILEDRAGSKERFLAWSTEAKMVGLGLFNRAKGFDAVQAGASDATDLAEIHDSPGADAFEAYADRATMSYDDGTVVRADDFRWLFAFASDDSQTDTARLYDTTADLGTSYATWLKGYDGVAKMYEVSTFYNRVDDFDEVIASAVDGDDKARLYDSPGADAFDGYADRATMSYADGTTVRADGVRWLFAFASDDGQTDTARLYDTTADLGTSYATWFKGFNDLSKMYEASTFYNRVDDFDEVIASAVGSNDSAKLYDSSGADALEAYADRATMTYPDGATVRTDDFRWVLAYGSRDGQVDTVQLYDTTADLATSYATWLKGENGFSRFYEETAFYVQAQRFDRVSATAVGDDDTAKLYDAALDDVYWSRPDHSRMEYADGTYTEALDFRYVLGYSRWGSDTATLYDETSGGTSYAARFTANADWAKLFSGAFFSRTEGFAEVRAATGGDDDLAWVEDDPARVDHLLVAFPGDVDHAAAKAKFWNDQRAIYIDDFHTLTATTSQAFVDDKDIDPAYEDDLILEGNWADAP